MPGVPSIPLSLSRPAELEPGAAVGSYTVSRVVGQGGWGTVYLARHAAIGSKVAIKVLGAHLATGTDACRRFLQEAKASSAIDSDHVVRVLDFGQLESGLPYIVMEWLEGRTLKDLLEADSQLEVPRALHIARQVARALSAAHHAGIIHRDLKPENVFLLSRDEDHDYVKILDFGIAKLDSPDAGVAHTMLDSGSAKVGSVDGVARTISGALLGTPYYMSPEQCAGGRTLDGRTDIYSLGIVLYEMLTGLRPFSAPGFGEILVKHITEAPAPPRSITPTLPRALEASILRMLAKDPRERPASMDEVARTLEGPFPDDPAEPVPEPVPEPVGEPAAATVAPRPRWLVPTLVALGLSALGIGLGILLEKEQSARAPAPRVEPPTMVAAPSVAPPPAPPPPPAHPVPTPAPPPRVEPEPEGKRQVTKRARKTGAPRRRTSATLGRLDEPPEI